MQGEVYYGVQASAHVQQNQSLPVLQEGFWEIQSYTKDFVAFTLRVNILIIRCLMLLQVKRKMNNFIQKEGNFLLKPAKTQTETRSEMCKTTVTLQSDPHCDCPSLPACMVQKAFQFASQNVFGLPLQRSSSALMEASPFITKQNCCLYLVFYSVNQVL